MQLDFVLFLLQPSLYLLFSSLCLLQFQMLYEYLVFYLAVGKNNPALAPLAQFFENASNNLQKVLGYVRMHCATRYDAKRCEANASRTCVGRPFSSTPRDAHRASWFLDVGGPEHTRGVTPIPSCGDSRPWGKNGSAHPPTRACAKPPYFRIPHGSIDRALTKCAPSDRAASPAA